MTYYILITLENAEFGKIIDGKPKMYHSLTNEKVSKTHYKRFTEYSRKVIIERIRYVRDVSNIAKELFVNLKEDGLKIITNSSNIFADAKKSSYICKDKETVFVDSSDLRIRLI